MSWIPARLTFEWRRESGVTHVFLVKQAASPIYVCGAAIKDIANQLMLLAFASYVWFQRRTGFSGFSNL